MFLRILAAIVLLGCSGCSGSTASPAQSASPASPSAPPAPTATIPPGVEARIETEASPESVVDAFGSIWVSDHRPGKLTRIDPSTNTVVATVDVGGGHIGPAIEVAGKLFVMTVDASMVVAIDPSTNRVVGSIRCDCEDEGGLTFVAGVLWFHPPGDMLWRIDPDALTVSSKVETISLATSVVVGKRWFGIDDARMLHEFDPRSAKAIAATDLKAVVGSGPIAATVVGSRILFATNDGTIAQYDVTSSKASAVAEVDVSELIPDPEAPLLIAATADAIYLRPAPEVILHVDPTSGELVKSFTGLPSGQYHSEITVAYGSLWVPHFSKASIWRISLAAL